MNGTEVEGGGRSVDIQMEDKMGLGTGQLPGELPSHVSFNRCN